MFKSAGINEMSRKQTTKVGNNSRTRLGLNFVGQYAIGISNEGEEEKKRGISERRRIHIKWSEQQRLKLQAEVQDVLEAVKDIEAMQTEMVQRSKWITKMKKSIVKQMQKGECDGPVPSTGSTFDSSSSEDFGPGDECSHMGNDGEEEDDDDDDGSKRHRLTSLGQS